MSGVPAIVTQGLTKSYGSSRGIVDVSMTIEAGEVFGFLGPNGAGKTTTIRTLLDFIRPTAGRATVLGLDPHRNSVEIHRRVGYLPGEFSLYEHMTGRDYLGFFATLRGGVDQQVIDALAERLQSDLDTKIASLSHGNRQKIGLVQAFMHQPPLLILDEPTQGLDPIVQQTFHGLVLEARQAGQTVFLSSHVLSEVERVCDRVGIIRVVAAFDRVEDRRRVEGPRTRCARSSFISPQLVPTDASTGCPASATWRSTETLNRCTVSGGSMDAGIG